MAGSAQNFLDYIEILDLQNVKKHLRKNLKFKLYEMIQYLSVWIDRYFTQV